MHPYHSTRGPIAARSIAVLATLTLISALLVPQFTLITATATTTLYALIAIAIGILPAYLYKNT